MDSKKIIFKFLKYLVPYWKQELITLIAIIITNIALLASPYILKIIIDDVLISKNYEALISILLVLLGLNVLRITMSFFSDYYYTWVNNHVMLDIRKDLFSHLIQLPMAFYYETSSSDIVYRINNEVNKIQSILTGSILRFLRSFILIIGITISLSLLNFKLFLIGISMLPLLYFNARYFHSRILKLTESVRKDESKLLEHFMDKFSHVKLIKIFNNYGYEIEKLTLKINKLISTNLKFQLLSSKAGSFSTFLMSTSPVLILLFGGNDVIKGTMTTGSLIAFIQYQNKLFGPFRDLMSLYTDAIKASVSMRRLFSYFDIKKEVTGTLKLEQNELDRHGISFKNVSFKRGNKFILNELSLKFDLGKSYALVGKSGCGKSTLIDLICGFETTNIGQISIGNKNVLDVSKASLRELISLVNQDGLLFKDTIKHNILYGNLETNKDDFNSAVSVSRINFLDKSLCIEKTSADEYEIVKLSGGQIQKVGIARTILKNPEILILDESTSALDSENEKKIIDNLFKLYIEKTLIIVSHRLSTIKSVDEIICMDNGQIVEVGSFNSLLQKQGFFYTLFSEQINHNI